MQLTRQIFSAALILLVTPSMMWAADLPPAALEADQSAAAQEPRILKGNDLVIAAPATSPALEGEASTFRFEEAPISEVVRTMLGDILKVNYVLHPPLNGSITLATRTPIPADHAIFLLESALQVNGLAMVRDARGSYHVGKVETLKNISAGIRQVSAGKPSLPPGTGAIIVPLQYIGAAEMATILKPMMPADALLRVDTVRNVLVLAGNRVQAEGWLEVVNAFDVNLLKGMSVGLFSLKYADIREVEAALRLVGGSGGASGGASAQAGAGTPPRAAVGGAASAPQAAPAMLSEGNPLYGALRVMPIERLNSILVVTPRAAYLEEARRWIEKFDQPSNGGAEPQLFIYKVQNGNARHLAGVLSGIFGGTPGPTQVSSGVAPTLSSSVGSSLGQSQSVGGAYGAALGGTGGGSTGMLGRSSSTLGGSVGTSAGFGGQARAGNQGLQGSTTGQTVVATLGNIRVIADELNNSVLVWSTRGEFEKIEATLKRLDLPPTQVLIEASIIEVTLTDDLKYGLKWAFTDTERRGLVGKGLVGSLPANSDGGFTYTLSNSLGVSATLNALASKSLLKVISSPSLMVLDNQLATIAVGNQQPVRSGEISTPTTGTNIVSTTTYQYKDTGVQLAVQPSVNSGNLVTMDINQSVTDVGEVDTATGQRSFLQRQIASKVAVRSGEAIVLGGLIKDNTTTGKSGVPVLSSLPIVGNLFGSTTTNNGRTELLVIITPKVVRTDPEIREVSEELRDRLRGLQDVELQGAAQKLGVGAAARQPSPGQPQ